MRAIVALLCGVLCLTSCSPTEPVTDIEVSTNKSLYEVDEGFNLRVVNLSRSSAWFETSCRGRLRYDLQKRNGWVWELWLPVNDCSAQGLAQTRALHPAREVWETGFWTIPPGRYRIRIPIGFESADIGRAEIYSKEFVVE
jgi:hypothetical protein